jgi:hypothetical protein
MGWKGSWKEDRLWRVGGAAVVVGKKGKVRGDGSM